MCQPSCADLRQVQLVFSWRKVHFPERVDSTKVIYSGATLPVEVVGNLVALDLPPPVSCAACLVPTVGAAVHTYTEEVNGQVSVCSTTRNKFDICLIHETACTFRFSSACYRGEGGEGTRVPPLPLSPLTLDKDVDCT